MSEMQSFSNVFDTNIISKYKNRISDSDLVNRLFSSVVWYEITATPIFSEKKKVWNDIFQRKLRQNLLVVPNVFDWFEASAILWKMRNFGGKHISNATDFQNDILICRSAFAWYAEKPRERMPIQIITDNLKDFESIAKTLHKHHKTEMQKRDLAELKITSGKDCFGF